MSFSNNFPTTNPTLELDFANVGALDPRITFTRANPIATVTNSLGLIQTVGANVPRFDHDPVTLAAKGLLIEEQRTNLLTYSEDFSNSVWNNATPNLPTVTTNTAVAPDGTTTADTLTAATGGTASQARQFVTTTSALGASYTGSLFVKQLDSTRSAVFLYETTSGFVTIASLTVSWSSGVPSVVSSAGTYSITSVGNGWYRLVITGVTVNANAQLMLSFFPDSIAGTNSAYAWGAQLEAGSFATSYIPTVASQVTRSADVASVNTLSPWYNATEGTLYGEAVFFGLGRGTSDGLVSLSNNSSAENIALFRTGSVNNIAGVMRDNSTDQSSYVVAMGSQPVKVAFAYATNNSNFALNGTAQTTDTACTLPTVDRLIVGSVYMAGDFPTNGHIRRITYYPIKLSSAQLQAITS